MTALTLMESLTRRGVKLSVRNHRLVIDAPKGVLTAFDRAELQANKLALLERLTPSRGTFSLPVPGPVDSADTLGGQGSPRSRSKSLQEKDFRATYCLGVHC